MLPRERVFEAIAHREPDRVPLYLWVFRQPGVHEAIEAKYGTFEAFCDALQLDLCQTFPARGLLRHSPAPAGEEKRNIYGRTLTLEEALEAEFTDPEDEGLYPRIRAEVAEHKGRKGRAIFLQTPGVFETVGGLLGLEQCLTAMALDPERVRALFERIAHWNHRYIENALAIGVDVIHISDDWGMNGRMLMRPQLWWELIYPTEKITCDFVRQAGARLSLHSDGYFMDVMDGVVALGFEVVHPVQASAGMDPLAFKGRYGDRLTMYGGLDVRSTLGRGAPDRVVAEVRWLMRHLKAGGGYLFCTSHMVQPGTPVEEIELAYQVALEEAWYR
jgi:uroporphyrinogen decarboxylase